MRSRFGFGKKAVIAICAVEVVSLVTIAVATIHAPLVSDTPEKPTNERADRTKRHPRAANRSPLNRQRIAQ